MPRLFLIVLLIAAAPLPVLAQSAAPTDVPRRAERSHDFDALHYRIRLDFDVPARAFRGETTVVLRALRDGFDRVALDAETFTVTDVQDGAGRTLAFSHTDGQLLTTLHTAHAYGDTVRLVVHYEASDYRVDPTRYGMGANYALGLDFKPETPTNPALINTLSFPEGARHWFPSYDHPGDRASQEVIATVPAHFEAISNGRLVDITDGDGTRTFHWHQALPHPTYLFVLVAGPYVGIEDHYGDLPLRYWVYPDAVPDAMRSFGKTPDILAFLEDIYGVPYPWARYDQITIPGIGGGAESTTATVVGESTIHDERADQDFPSHWLVAHEAAHHWWGNMVSYRDWTHTWVSESFATFSEYLWSVHDLGPDEGAINLLNKKNAYLREARDRYIRPIVLDRWHFPNENFDRHTYEKGAVVLNMLRHVMGEAPFRRTMTHILTEHAFRPIDTHDVATAIKDVTGQNLDWFFEQWLLKPGHPVLDIASAWSEDTQEVLLMVNQRQDTTLGVPIYRMPVAIGLSSASGPRVETVWLSSPADTFRFAAETRPLMVRFDVGNVLLKEWKYPKPVDELHYQLANDDAIGRMWAATQLGENHRSEDTQAALVRAARSDAFWAVRRAAIQAIDTRAMNPVRSREFLADIATTDPHSRVREAALDALGATRDATLFDLFAARYRDDDSYVAQAAALRAMGHTNHPDARRLLDEAKVRASPRNVLRTAALNALEMLDAAGR